MTNSRTKSAAALGLAITSGCAGAAPSPVTPSLAPSVALDDVAHGRRTLASLADPRVGIAYVLHRSDMSEEDPRANEDGEIRVGARLCDPSDPTFTALTSQLAMHYEPENDHVPVVCDGLVCTAPGPMEFATTLRFVFERDRAGTLTLARIYEVEDVAVVEEYVHRAWNWVEMRADELPEGCP